MRLGTAPRYSLVIASRGPRSELEACLAALGPVCRERQVEMVVARATDRAEFADLVRQHTDVLFMPAPDGSDERQLRVFGLGAAEGDIVVFTDDTMRDPAFVMVQTRQLDKVAGG